MIFFMCLLYNFFNTFSYKYTIYFADFSINYGYWGWASCFTANISFTTILISRRFKIILIFYNPNWKFFLSSFLYFKIRCHFTTCWLKKLINYYKRNYITGISFRGLIIHYVININTFYPMDKNSFFKVNFVLYSYG